jgi:tRNA-specific 2-thiouridylase
MPGRRRAPSARAARLTISTTRGAVAATLGIPHYIVNFEREFADTVISNFVDEYASGRTPIPCVHCNGDLKFATLVSRAKDSVPIFVATGHYAQVDLDPASGRYLLKRGTDPAKDQSYFLFTLTQEQLSHAMFPLARSTRAVVRDCARELGLLVARNPTATRSASSLREHTSFLEERGTSARGGAIRDVTGKTVGTHAGIHRFTVGQRKGLGLSSPIPLYVVALDAASRPSPSARRSRSSAANSPRRA